MRLLLPATATVLLAAFGPAQMVIADEAVWEQETFASLTLTDEQFLRGDRAMGVPVTLSAEAEPCRAYIDKLHDSGKDAAMVEYPGAFHGFDLPTLGPPALMHNVQNAASCHWREDSGQIIDTTTSERFSWNDPCVTLDITNGYNAAADTAAKSAVRSFLVGVFKLG